MITARYCIRETPFDDLFIAIAVDFYPFAFIKDNNAHGIEIELISLLEKRLRNTITLSTYPSSRLLEAFYCGDYDFAVGGITITESRLNIFYFSTYYYNATQTVVARNDSDKIIDNIWDITNYQVGIKTSSSSLLFLESTLRRQAHNNISRFVNYDLLFTALKEGDIDIILVEHTIADLACQLFEFNIIYEHYIKEKYAIVFSGDSPVLSRVNRELNQIKNSSEWRNLLMYYLLDILK
jgi:polar amino acid transport system substrate-binding protein